MKKFVALVAFAAGLSVAACSSVGSLVSEAVVSTTVSTPTQVKTVDEAVKATSLAERGLDAAVNAGTFSKAVLQQLKVDVEAVHNTLVAAEAANASGNSAAIAAGLAGFNEALAAYNSYKALKGIQ